MESQSSGERTPGNGSDAWAPEQMLGRPAVWQRLVVTGLVAVVGAPVIPPALLLTWLALYLLITLAERAIVVRRGFVASDLPGLAVTLALSALDAWAALELIQRGDGGPRFFAVALIGFSIVSALMRHYASRRMFLAATSPHALVLAWVAYGIFARHLAAGEALKAATPICVLLIYAILLLPARQRLAQAWGRLGDAKHAAEAASRAKSQFLATMSHEIRTPLNGILGMAQAMQRDELSPAQRERLRVIRRSGQGLLGLLNDALDFSQIEAGRLALESSDFDMEHLTRGAVATFMPLAANKGLAFDYSIDQAAKGRYRGDPVRLRQILYNLASNAVKFTDQGRVAVGVSWTEGEGLVLEVADSGVGIAPKRQEIVFERFVQGDGSITRRHDGVGLGLAICKSIVELMGGRISVSSAEGRGSIFTVTLPLERVSEPTLVATAAVEAPAAEAGETPVRILAAEDNAVNQIVLKTLLTQAGFEATVVEDGAQAVAAWKDGPWDLILMDIQMPVMDGVTATREIRAFEAAEGRARTPIIAVTANAMSHQVEDYIAAGMDEVAPKPIDTSHLFGAIERALQGADHAAAA